MEIYNLYGFTRYNGISTTFYDNFSDEDIATLFIKILNNVNDLNVQEKNNATRSRLADFVRYTSRNGNGKWLDTADMFHELFSRDDLFSPISISKRSHA